VDAGPRRWPLALIAAPAAVAIWSGWVGLGELCGFGPVRLLPGITGLTVNTAITLPVGVEAYAAYALGAWMSPASPPGARRFARWSALGALAYGMAGQIIYHLLAAAHAVAAPWPVVVVVSCMPVAVLGLAAGLTHLLRAPAPAPALAPWVHPQSAPALTNGHSAPEGGQDAARRYAAWLSRGEVPSVRQVRREMHLGQPRAQEVRAYLETLTRALDDAV
jgi:hypothetical protein